MSKYGEYTIISFENEILQIQEILDISLNVIFFHRYLGNNDYEDVQSKPSNISYVKLKNEKLSNKILKILNEIENNFKKNIKQYGQRLILKFYEKEKNQKELETPWEIWNFILILSNKEDLKEKKDINNIEEDDKENHIREYIFKIIEKLNDKGNYMPNINIEDESLKEETFFYDIQIEQIPNKEDYLSLFNNFVKKNQENIIVINQLS